MHSKFDPFHNFFLIRLEIERKKHKPYKERRFICQQITIQLKYLR